MQLGGRCDQLARVAAMGPWGHVGISILLFFLALVPLGYLPFVIVIGGAGMGMDMGAIAQFLIESSLQAYGIRECVT
jgi:hypothetical protein